MPAKQVSTSNAALGCHSAPEGAQLVPPARSGRSGHVAVRWSTDQPSMTRQEFAQDADINVLMGRYIATGVIPPAVRQGYFADVDACDYQSAMELVKTADLLFDQLPSKIRERFANDPSRLMAFMDDPSNRDEAVSLGILDAPRASQESRGEAFTPNPVPTPSGKTGGA